MSSLKAVYQNFLANPTASALTEDASLNYITTLTSIHTAAAVAKHLTAHQRVLKKNQEKVLSAIESEDALCLDVETTLELLTGGGAYLPGLDENFLADRVVTFPIVHIVHFDGDRIQQIRLYWDQGSLLKLVDVIGSRARNWPIRDGKDQARLIASSAAATSQGAGPKQPASKASSRDPNEAFTTTKPTESRKNVTGDPHASLSLFGARETESEPLPTVVAPRASAKPPPRDYHDLFVGSDSESAPAAQGRLSSPTKENRTGTQGHKGQTAKPPPRDYHDLFVGNESDASPATKAKPSSPQKENRAPSAIAPKGGSGKNFQPSRLFDTDDSKSGTPPQSPSKFIQPHPDKYKHFEMGADDDNTVKKPPGPSHPTSKNQAKWGFEDFDTPDKVPSKIRGQDVRHFGWSDDEPNLDSPVKHPKVVHPRPDAKANFEFKDVVTPAGNRPAASHPRGRGVINGLSLYENNLYDDDAELSASPKKNRPLSTVTNLKDRRKDFEPHSNMTNEAQRESTSDIDRTISELRMKSGKSMDSQQEAGIRDPNQTSHPSALKSHNDSRPASRDQENFATREPTMIKLGGDGMGGKMGAGRTWGFGDESDEEGAGGINGGKFLAGKKQQAPRDNVFWDY